MSTAMDYIKTACGYDENGRPAALTNITFGYMPFLVAEGERAEDFTQISKVFTTQAVVSFNAIDKITRVDLDFTADNESFAELILLLDEYKAQLEHTLLVAGEVMSEIEAAKKIDSRYSDESMPKVRNLSIPFMLPTILPTRYDNNVYIGFKQDPKFFGYFSEAANRYPVKLSMFFSTEDVFVEDEEATYAVDAEEEFRLQQEEMMYELEAKRAEEEAYRSMYGFDLTADGETKPKQERNKGIRF